MKEIAAPIEHRRAEFARVVLPVSPRLRRGLAAQFGVEIGSDVTADALAWGWEHLDRVSASSNPAGLLFRVGQSAARRHRRWQRGRVTFPADGSWMAAHSPELDDEVVDALKVLKPRQRVAVLLVHGYGFSYREVGELLGVSDAAVTNHIHRGLMTLRRTMEASE